MTENKFLYLYCFVPTSQLEAESFPCLPGIDGNSCYVKSYNELTAVICDVNPCSFSEESLEAQLRDPEWLRSKGTHHHECIERLYEKYTVLPVPFCTLFENETSLQEKLAAKSTQIAESLVYLHHKQEWNLRMFVNPSLLSTFVERESAAIGETRGELAKASRGKQFFMEKQLKRIIAEESLQRISQAWGTLTQQLCELTSGEFIVRDNWPRELTGRSEDLVANSVFLIPISLEDEFRKTVQVNEATLKTMGLTLDYSGPWPPYHFSAFSKGGQKWNGE